MHHRPPWRPSWPWPSNPNLTRALAFLLLFGLLQTLYLRAPGQWPERLLIEGLTVPAAAQLLAWLLPDLAVRAEGAALLGPDAALRVLRGCEGSELLLIWCAAMLVAPLQGRWRLPLLAAGLPLLFLLNQLRVLLLFQLQRSRPEWFATAHDLLLPLLLVGLTGGLVLWCLKHFAPQPR